MSEPVVSVVVPAYRQASMISATLDSIAVQRFTGAIEAIVVDDGCPEGTGEVARAHALRPRVIRQENQGVAAARNTGIAESRGRYLAFLDGDDRFLPDKLALQVARLEAGGPGLCFGRYWRVDPDGRRLDDHDHPGAFGEPGPRSLFRGNYVGCLTALVDRRCLLAVGGFPLSPALGRGGQDYALWLRLSLRYPLLYEPNVIGEYVVHDRNRVGADFHRNFAGAIAALGAVFECDRELCREKLGRSYRSLLLEHTRRASAGLLNRRELAPAVWSAFGGTVARALRHGPASERAIWPQPLREPGSTPRAGA